MPIEPQSRITLTGRQELDRLANLFRCRLRDAALELSADTKDFAAIDSQVILQAVASACRDLLSDLGPDAIGKRGSHGSTQEAA